MINKIKNRIYNILRQSEKYTQTDMVYLAKGGFWLTLGYGTNILKGLILSILMANLLAKESYGYYRYILSIFSLVGIFSIGGMSTAITQSVARNLDGIFKQAIKIILKWSLLGSVALLVISAYYFNKHNLNFTWIFIFLALLFPWYSISSYYGAILSGKKRFDVQTKYFTIYSLITSIVIITTILLTSNVFWIIFAFILSDGIVGGFFTYRASKKYLLNDKVDPDSLNYGVKLSLIGIIGLIAQNIDKVILPILLGFQELAVYSIALVVPEQIKVWFNNFGTLALPKFSEHKPSKEIKEKIIKASFKAMILVFLIIIIYWISATWIFNLIYPKYTEAIIYSKVLSLSLLAIPSFLINNFFKGNKRSDIILKENIFYSSLQILSVIIFTYFFGLWGLVFARTITRLFTFVYDIYLLKKMPTSI